MAVFRKKAVPTIEAIKLTGGTTMGDAPLHGEAGDYVAVIDGVLKIIPAAQFEAEFVPLETQG
jgi:hypothetical protein